MNIFSTSKILTLNVKNNPLFKNVLCRSLTTLFEKEFTVSPFCNVNVKLPFNVTIKPLDVHKYRNHDKLIIKLSSNITNSDVDVHCDYKTDTFNISCNQNEPLQDVTCNVEAPIKANINVEADYGDVNLSSFNGESIKLMTRNGNIFASKCHCKKISISSSSGNITCSNVMQAAEIHLKTNKRGSITTDRLQGLVLTAETENGDIQTASSYCNNSSFTTTSGCLDLHSAHKNCKVAITDKGILNMVGFDGLLQVDVKEGDAVIQLAKIENNSKIKIQEHGSLRLKLFGTILENTKFKLNANSVKINDDININASTENGHTILGCNKQSAVDVTIDCPKSPVIVQGASLLELFNLKLPT